MKTLFSWFATVALVVSAHAQNVPIQHCWTNHQGRTVTGEFVDLSGSALTLRVNGRLFTLPLDRLSPQSASLARELAAKIDPPSLNSAVLAACREQIGRRVGNGQCTSLANHSLAEAGAAGITRESPAAGDYVWGALVTVVSREPAGVKGIPTLAEIRGGDIIQMRNVLLNGGTPNGGTYSMVANHHTAVVEAADPARGTLTVLHQNWGGGPVRRDVFNLSDLKRGWMRIYRPVPKP